MNQDAESTNKRLPTAFNDIKSALCREINLPYPASFPLTIDSFVIEFTAHGCSVVGFSSCGILVGFYAAHLCCSYSGSLHAWDLHMFILVLLLMIVIWDLVLGVLVWQ